MQHKLGLIKIVTTEVVKTFQFGRIIKKEISGLRGQNQRSEKLNMSE